MLKKEQIHIRDPFILVEDGKYYMYGSRGPETWGKCTGLDVYVSEDLENWSEPNVCFTPPADFWSDMNYWAPEVHKYNGNFYMFVSFKSEDKCRGTQILKAESPVGPFVLHSDGPVTPREWECLDGTLYVAKNGTPYIIFCHEWVQVKDGGMCALELTPDLKQSVGAPRELFKASSFEAVTSVLEEDGHFVTDGPFFHRAQDGQLLMIWSSYTHGKYCEVVSYSDNGDIDGNWFHKKEMLFAEDGGHGMIFKDLQGDLRFVMHIPNEPPKERPSVCTVVEADGTLRVK